MYIELIKRKIKQASSFHISKKIKTAMNNVCFDPHVKRSSYIT